MQKRSLLKIGVVGTAITALCCFTPLLAVVFGAAGLSAWLAGADMVLLPLLAAFIVLTGYSLWTGRSRSSNGTP